MATAVSICSNALQQLGAGSFTDFNEASSDGANIQLVKLCDDFWPVVRRRVLRSNSWSECTKRVVLSPSVNAPAFGYAHQFPIPGDWLRTETLEDSNGNILENYVVENRNILSDDSVLYLKYIFDQEDPAFYSSTLVDILELAMVAKLAYPVTKSTSLAEGAKQEYEYALRNARAHDANEDPNPTMGDSYLTAARFGRRT